MADQPNFLLGKGERLTEPIVMAGRKVDPGRSLHLRAGTNPRIANGKKHCACPRRVA